MNPYVGTALMLLVFFTLLFILAQYLENNSIVDSFWGPSFLLIALYTLITADSPGLRQNLLTAVVALWSLRLFYYITLRNWNKPEDYRYVNMRKRWGTKLPRLKAYANVFLLQGVLSYLVGLPLIRGNSSDVSSLSILNYVGIALFAIGFFFEAVGDAQLKNFKKDPANKGKLMNEIIVDTIDSFIKHPILSVKIMPHAVRIQKLLRQEGYSRRSARNFWTLNVEAGFIVIWCDDGERYVYNTRTKSFLP